MTNNSSLINVLFLIQSFIPSSKHTEYFSILQNTIRSIKKQEIDNCTKIKIVITDDGSGYLKNYLGRDIDIQILSSEKIAKINEQFILDIDEIACSWESEYFRKADLFNFYLKSKGCCYDLVIFLDDDHNFIKNDSLMRFINHYRNGYNFIVGRFYHPEACFDTVNNGLYNWGIQGTTYAVSYKALEKLGFFSESVREWGFAEDYDIFRKAYLASLKSEIRAVFDGNIITVDNISGRWQYCIKKIGGIEIGIKKFEAEHNVTFKEAAIPMNEWMDVVPNKYGLHEFTIKNINLTDFLTLELLLEKNKKVEIVFFAVLIFFKHIRWFLILSRSKLFRILLSEKTIDFIKTYIQYKKPKRN